jgi:formylglycine-generating enzyme required for sulfatase activity
MYRRLLILLLFALLLSWAGDASAQTTQNITLRPGFNFISFSVSITLTPAGFKALNSSIEDIYLFSAAAGSFLSVNEGTLTTLAAGKGYIVKNSSLVNVSVSVSGTALSTLGNISLKSGFNLVGFSKAPGSTTAFTALMNTYSFVSGLYKWSAAAGSFISVVRDNGGVPVKLDGVDPSFGAGESYFFNLSEDTLLNYDGTGVLMGKTIEPPVVVTDNPFAGTYTGTFAGNYGPPQGTFTLTVSVAGALGGSGYNNSNNPPTVISPSGTVSNEGTAVFYVTFNNQHKFGGTFTAAGASGSFYEIDGTTVKGSWSATKNAVTPQTVATPVITPAGGTFTVSQSVTITCATSGATIKYTTDGSTPSSSAGNTYSAAITVSSTSVIKAVAIKSGMTDSAIATASFTIGTQPSGSVPFLRKFGNKGTGNGQFASGPINVAVEASTGYIFVSDTYAHRILKFDYQGNYVSTFGSMGSGNGQFMYPTGIAVTGGGEMFVVDYGNKRVQKFMTGGTFLKAFGTAGTGDGQFQAPDCVAVDKYGSVYVTDFTNNNVQRFSSEGTFSHRWGGAGTGNGQFGANSPKDIAVDSSSNVYVADLGNNRIQKFNAYGTYQTQWGASGTGGGQFTSPHGVCADSDGHIFVSDKSCRIQKFSPMGDFILSWGSSGSADGQFSDPSGICSDSNGNIYVADFGNSRVQVFGTASAPVVETVATPSFTPAAGTYTTAQSVTITCATSGASIYYTTDGSAPSSSNGTLYASAISVSANTTIKAAAFKSGMNDSAAASAVYVIESGAQPGETLTIDLGGGVMLQMVKISAAGKSFQMGSPAAETGRNEWDGPVHTVSFTKDYYIGKYEITQAQWLKIQGSWPGGSQAPSSVYGLGDSYPAYYVSWNDICGTGGFLENINAAKPGGYSSFRLPSEAEWEYAARGGTQTRFYWGDDISGTAVSNYAWYYNNSSAKTHTVGGKQSNAYGIYDISGNVGEWCLDYYAAYGTLELIDPMGPSTGLYRVYRGGSFTNELSGCRNSSRNNAFPDDRMHYYGFRLAMCLDTAPPVQQKVQTPVITPAGGAYTTAQSVSITCATEGAVIYYTHTGAEPTVNSAVYTGPLNISANATIKAIAAKTGMTDSDVASQTYTINYSSSGFTGFTAGGSMPASRYNGPALSYGGKLWLIGGRGSAGYFNDVLSSPDGANWTSVKANVAAAGTNTHFEKRIGHAAVVFNNKMWVIGGYSGETFAYKNDLWHSSDGASWTKAAATAPFNGRAHHSVVVFNNKMYLIGGVDDTGSFSDVMSSSDGETWTPVVNIANFDRRSGHSCIIFNNKLWVIGGASPSILYNNDVWSSADGVTWDRLTAAASFSPRTAHRSLVYDNKMWVLGGGTAEGYSAEAWYSTDGINWSQPAGVTSMFTGRSYFMAEVFGGRMWVMGGRGTTGSFLSNIFYSTY